MREAVLEARLRRGVEALGGVCCKWTSPGRRGVPDRICILPGGRVYFVEMKAPGGRLSDWQKLQRDILLGLGAQWRCLKTPGEVAEFLKSLGEGSL